MWYTKNDKLMLLHIRVVPNSSYTSLKSIEDDKLVFQLKAKPENNHANVELIKYLAKLCKIGTQEIKILSGHKSRDKTVMILSEKKDEVLMALITDD